MGVFKLPENWTRGEPLTWWELDGQSACTPSKLVKTFPNGQVAVGSAVVLILETSHDKEQFLIWWNRGNN